jgi:precorrin-6B methylase 1
MLYTLAFNNVNTRLVFLSRPRSPSRIAALGLLERSRRRVDICASVSERLWMWKESRWEKGEEGWRGTDVVQIAE